MGKKAGNTGRAATGSGKTSGATASTGGASPGLPVHRGGIVLTADYANAAAGNPAVSDGASAGGSAGQAPTPRTLKITMEPVSAGRIDLAILRDGQHLSCSTLTLDSNLLLRAETTVKNQLAILCNDILRETKGRRGW